MNRGEKKMKENLNWLACDENTSFVGHKNQLVDVVLWVVFFRQL